MPGPTAPQVLQNSPRLVLSKGDPRRSRTSRGGTLTACLPSPPSAVAPSPSPRSHQSYISVHAESQTCPSPMKGRGGGLGGVGTYLSWCDCAGQRASSIGKAALTAGTLSCENGAPRAAPRHSVPAHNLLTQPSPPEMGILKHHKNASPSAEGRHLGVGMRWNWMGD